MCCIQVVLAAAARAAKVHVGLVRQWATAAIGAGCAAVAATTRASAAARLGFGVFIARFFGIKILGLVVPFVNHFDDYIDKLLHNGVWLAIRWLSG